MAIFPNSVAGPVCCDLHQAAPGQDRGAHESLLVDSLVDRFTLPGQDGLIHGQLGPLEQPAVARHLLPGAEQHQVTGHQLPDFDLAAFAVAQDSGGWFKQALECGVGLLGLVFLDETQDDIDHDNCHDDGEISIFPGNQ